MIEEQDIIIYMKGTNIHTFTITDEFKPVKFDMTTQDSRKHVIFLNSEIRYYESHLLFKRFALLFMLKLEIAEWFNGVQIC